MPSEVFASTTGRFTQTTSPKPGTTIKPVYNRPKAVSSTTTKTKKAVVKKKVKPALIKLAQHRGPRYTVDVEFSADKGKSFSSSKLEAKPLKHYRVKAKFNQFQAEPLLQGCRLRWILPTGWKWIDGGGSYTYETLVSNPLDVIRICKSPSKVKSAYVKVLVVKVFG